MTSSNPRVKQDITQQQLESLLKDNVASLDDDRYLCSDIELVVKAYEPFLRGVARHTRRVNKVSVQSACVSVFGYPKEKAKLFGQQMELALTHCRIKEKGVKTGARLSKQVKSVQLYKVYSTKCLAEPKSGSLPQGRPPQNTISLSARFPAGLLQRQKIVRKGISL